MLDSLSSIRHPGRGRGRGRGDTSGRRRYELRSAMMSATTDLQEVNNKKKHYKQRRKNLESRNFEDHQ